MKKALMFAGGVASVVALITSGCVVQTVPTGAGGNTQGTGTYGTTSGSSTYGTTGGSVTTGSGMLDPCSSCQSQSCSAQFSACVGGSCATVNAAWQACLTVNGQPSGYTSEYCAASAGAAAGDPASALFSCAATSCTAVCNVTAPVTWTNFAMKFTEDFCAGCHFPGASFDLPDPANPGSTITKVVPTDIPQFTDDPMWSYWNTNGMGNGNPGPEANPMWNVAGVGDSFTEVTGAVAAAMFPENVFPFSPAQSCPSGDPCSLPEKIWCGVSAVLPPQCGADFPGKYPNPERFPPSGNDANKPSVICAWATDGMTCPQPTADQRAKMSSWVFDGTPM